MGIWPPQHPTVKDNPGHASTGAASTTEDAVQRSDGGELVAANSDLDLTKVNVPARKADESDDKKKNDATSDFLEADLLDWSKSLNIMGDEGASASKGQDAAIVGVLIGKKLDDTNSRIEVTVRNGLRVELLVREVHLRIAVHEGGDCLQYYERGGAPFSVFEISKTLTLSPKGGDSLIFGEVSIRNETPMGGYAVTSRGTLVRECSGSVMDLEFPVTLLVQARSLMSFYIDFPRVFEVTKGAESAGKPALPLKIVSFYWDESSLESFFMELDTDPCGSLTFKE